VLQQSLNRENLNWEMLPLKKKKLIEQHLRLVLEANKKTNLTRISSYDEGVLLHVEDSLVGLQELSGAPEGFYADMGSGAGYPGIPLSIALGKPVLLIDSVAKKMIILDSIIKELGLESHISTYSGRIEELSRERGGEFAVLTARALTSLPSLLELAAPLLQLFGQLVCFKAQPSAEEVEAAMSLEEKLGLTLVSDRKTMLSDKTITRRIMVFEKQAQPKTELPRRTGLAQKRPLA